MVHQHPVLGGLHHPLLAIAFEAVKGFKSDDSEELRVAMPACVNGEDDLAHRLHHVGHKEASPALGEREWWSAPNTSKAMLPFPTRPQLERPVPKSSGYSPESFETSRS